VQRKRRPAAKAEDGVLRAERPTSVTPAGMLRVLHASDGTLASVEASGVVLTIGPHAITGEPYLVDWYVRGEGRDSARADLRAGLLLRSARRQGYAVQCERHVSHRLALAPVRLYGPLVLGLAFVALIVGGAFAAFWGM
jgi:hypothetical protein